MKISVHFGDFILMCMSSKSQLYTHKKNEFASHNSVPISALVSQYLAIKVEEPLRNRPMPTVIFKKIILTGD